MIDYLGKQLASRENKDDAMAKVVFGKEEGLLQVGSYHRLTGETLSQSTAKIQIISAFVLELALVWFSYY